MDDDERRGGDDLPRIIGSLTGGRVVHDTGWTVEQQFVEDGELLPGRDARPREHAVGVL